MRKTRVMIIEDSATVRSLLEEIVERDPRLEIAASVGSAEEGLRVLRRAAPDVISLDIRLPGMDGFEAVRRIMSERPTPIVVVSASVEDEDLKISINALKAGALAIVEKPAGGGRPDFHEMASAIAVQLDIMSRVKVVRQRRPSAPARRVPRFPPRAFARPTGALRALGLAASTGGPNALEAVLGGLPADFPAPILVVQHIVGSFLEGFAAWLGGVCPFRTAPAEDGEVPVPGRVYVAPADRHLTVRGGRIVLDAGPPVSGQRPSGTVLFESLAREYGSGAAGVILTGMGDDGARGLAALREAGGATIAEHESTAVVYGMPKCAVRLGAACESLPLGDISGRLAELAWEDADDR